MDETKGIDLLVVDDDPDFRGTVARRYLRRGYRVYEASDGAEALDMANRRDIDVAILDRCARLRSDMLTGQGTVESAVEAMKLGAYD